MGVDYEPILIVGCLVDKNKLINYIKKYNEENDNIDVDDLSYDVIQKITGYNIYILQTGSYYVKDGVNYYLSLTHSNFFSPEILSNEKLINNFNEIIKIIGHDSEKENNYKIKIINEMLIC